MGGMKQRKNRTNTSNRSKTNADPHPSDNEQQHPNFIHSAVIPAIISTIATVMLGNTTTTTDVTHNRIHFCLRFLLFLTLEATWSSVLSQCFVIPARYLARILPGSTILGKDERSIVEEEHTQHDPTLIWPIPGTELPSDWMEYISTTTTTKQINHTQPYFLNHVRGCVRIRQAALRVGGAFGTLFQIYLMAYTVDRRSPTSIGVSLAPIEFILGVITGSILVIGIFITEVMLGWIRIVGYNEVIISEERLHLNLLWDVIFHIAVSINEEVSLRGWLLINMAHASVYHFDTTPTNAILCSVLVQALVFAFMHIGSPGATKWGLVNLVVGGVAAALNVILTGGLSFGIGWHFGWNICMGHLLGMSTSGIPMSAKLVSVVPDPRKEVLHGGRFGPEGGPLAPIAYVVGCMVLVGLYGGEGIGIWRERLQAGEL